MLYRVSLAISLQNRPVGTHDETIESADPLQAADDAAAKLREAYDERHVLTVMSVRRAALGEAADGHAELRRQLADRDARIAVLEAQLHEHEELEESRRGDAQEANRQ
jgi:hypothetical protein